jgi:hypothetical protein
MIEEVFGAGGSLKTTNPFLKPAEKKTMMEIYWRIFEIVDFTKNVFGEWLVKGFIAEVMGHNID